MDAGIPFESTGAVRENANASLGRRSRRAGLQRYQYYVRPSDKQGKTWEEVPTEIKETFDKLGIPEAEQKFLAGVSAQYESEVVYHNMQKDQRIKALSLWIPIRLLESIRRS